MKGDRLTISTQNTRGLGQGFAGNKKRREIKDLFKHTTPSTDILLLQEIKLSEAACLKQARFIEFRKGISFWNEASFSARTTKFKGGTGILISERLADSITSHGVLYPGRAQYITIQLSPALLIGIINVYGYSEPGPRAMLWNHLAQTELPEANWIIAGDFNNIEQTSDKQGGDPTTTISRRELESWNRLLLRLGCRDAHHVGSFVRKSDKAFTWSNSRTDDKMIQSRIDRFYIPICLENIGGTTEILPTLQVVSDHAGVVLHFNGEPRGRKKATVYFNKGLLAHPESKAALLATWKAIMEDETIPTWNQKVVKASLAIRQKSEEITKSHKQLWKETYLAQFEDIIAAETKLQSNWGSREARDRLSDAQVKLHEVRQQKLQFQEMATLSKWSRVGDICTKEFFEHFSGQRKRAPITHMKDEDRIISTQAELEEHILQFYKELYTADDLVENNQAAREDCFKHVKVTVTADHNAELLKPITIEEVKEAMKQLPSGKAPGIDSIPAEFYQELWEEIEMDIFNFASESIEKTYINEDLNISKIALLPKTEDMSRIKNFRPISLLNTLYKLVAKIYANRMKPLLHHWILPSQTGFVPNRCILDNVFLAFESIEWALESNQDLSLLLLDFEKAYDRVSWTFLQQAMERMGFEATWIRQVMSLNLTASATIIVNGEQSQPFKLQRSVRQGCPLAPYLFLLTVDVLGQMLQHPDCEVRGLRLPDRSIITNQMFADDTLLLLEGNPDNMDKALEVINRFGAASGARLNLHKSVGLWVSHTPRTWTWGEDAGLKWLQPGEATRYLGYPFGLHLSQQEKDNKMLGQIRKHLHRWAGNKLSLAGRIMVANQVILSSIWYLASCMDFSNEALKLVRATVRNYMWSGKQDTRARARVKWSTAVLPIVRGGVKIIDPQWQASALLVKLLVRGMSFGYEPWKTLVRHRVAQTRQSRRGRWPVNANWIMNNQRLTKQGSTMWQGVMKAWNSIQSGLEQQPPTSWAEIMRQPLFGNRLLTDERGVQWGTDARYNMRWWAEKGFQSLKDIIKENGQGWRTYQELLRLRRTRVAPTVYARMVNSIPWLATPRPPHTTGQWLAPYTDERDIQIVYHLKHPETNEATLYIREQSEQLTLLAHHQQLPLDTKEVRVVRTFGPKNTILDYNPVEDSPAELSLWLWGQKWIEELEWDPKDWNWRRIGVLPDSTSLNYTTKRGYRVAMRQENHQMPVDAELEASGIDSKTRAKFFNRNWHPYLPRKVSALQWLIITEGLPVGAWRERLGQDGVCQICPHRARETLTHAFADCEAVQQAWDLFRRLRTSSGQNPAYNSWKEISRGLLSTPPGPSVVTELQWDTAAAFTINSETPWDTLRAQLLWAIWCQRVAHAFSDEKFHLGLVLWHSWKNTIYCAMEAYKELHRHKRNEEKRQEQIQCFQQVWTTAGIFGRLHNTDIKWRLVPPTEFLPQELGAWMASPIRIIRRSPSPDSEAEYAAHPDFPSRVEDFLEEIGNNFPLPDAQDTPSQSTQTGRDHTTQEPSTSHSGEPPAQQFTTTQQESSPRTDSSRPICREPERAVRGTDGPRTPLTDLNLNRFNGQRLGERYSAPTDTTNRERDAHTDNENQQPRASDHDSTRGQTELHQALRSRPKVRCNFGPTRRIQTNTQQHTTVCEADTDSDSADLDILLQEIESTRLQGGEFAEPPDLTPHSVSNDNLTPEPYPLPRPRLTRSFRDAYIADRSRSAGLDRTKPVKTPLPSSFKLLHPLLRV